MNLERWSGSVGAPRPWRTGGLTLPLTGRAGGTKRAASGAVADRITSQARRADGGRDVSGATV